MKRFSLLLFFNLVLRLCLLPFTSVTNEGDSISRILIAWRWLEHPTFISHAGWGPLHFYLIAGALRIWFNPIVSPSVLHILISVATAIPLWAFVRREWGEPGAIFVGAAFLFYPLAFRLSFMPASEVPFVFFVAWTMYFVSRARSESKILDAILAGISITLASALRVEAWVLIVLFGCLLWGRWQVLCVYLISASVFPVFWMIGNVFHGLDPIAHLTTVRNWQLNVEGINEGLNTTEIIRRLVYFPTVTFFGLTPPICILCLAGAGFSLKDKASRIWLIPFCILMPIFMIRTAQGLGTTQARFSLVLGLLLLPFSAVAINRIKDRSWALPVAFLCILLMIPFSYSRSVWYRLAGPSFPNPFPADINAIPRIDNPTKEIARIVAENLKSNDCLVIDFFGKDFYGWKDTLYVALMSHVHPSRLFIMPGARHQPLSISELTGLLQQYPSGLLLRSDDSRFIHLEQTTNGAIVRIDGYKDALIVHPIASVKSITIYRYIVERPHG
jgi:hypothetical protein